MRVLYARKLSGFIGTRRLVDEKWTMHGWTIFFSSLSALDEASFRKEKQLGFAGWKNSLIDFTVEKEVVEWPQRVQNEDRAKFENNKQREEMVYSAKFHWVDGKRIKYLNLASQTSKVQE